MKVMKTIGVSLFGLVIIGLLIKFYPVSKKEIEKVQPTIEKEAASEKALPSAEEKVTASETKKEHYENGALKREIPYIKGLRHGIAKGYYVDGTIKEEETYQMGFQHGATKYYYPSGAIREKLHFQYGTRNGKWSRYYEDGAYSLKGVFLSDKIIKMNVYYEDSQPYVTVAFKDGKADGLAKQYYQNGNLAVEGRFKKGTYDGEWKCYDETGNESLRLVYDDGVIMELEGEELFFPGKNYRQGTIAPIKEGMQEVVWEKGELAIESMWRNWNQNGEINHYYDTGEIRVQYELKNGKEYGPITYYYRHGQKNAQGELVEGEWEGELSVFYESGHPFLKATYRKNSPVGITSIYYENGQLFSEQNYRKSEITWRKQYGLNGQVMVDTVLLENGVWKTVIYNASGKPESEVHAIKEGVIAAKLFLDEKQKGRFRQHYYQPLISYRERDEIDHSDETKGLLTAEIVLYYQDKRLSELTKISPRITILEQNEVKSSYSEGKFKFFDLKPGNYTIKIDVDANNENPENYAGDFGTSVQMKIKKHLVAKTLVHLSQGIHLTYPVDNAQDLPGKESFEGLCIYASPVTFEWVSLGEDVEYYCVIENVGTSKKIEKMTKNTKVTFDLPLSDDNKGEYNFKLTAYKGEIECGTLLIHRSDWTAASKSLDFSITSEQRLNEIKSALKEGFLPDKSKSEEEKEISNEKSTDDRDTL